MSKLIDAALGIHPQALSLGAKRMELLAANIANSDTPNYKARDVDFRAALEGAMKDSGTASTLRTTHSGHQSGAVGGAQADALYRIPNHPALDGNTVDAQMEQASFAEAAVRYQASLDFLAGRVESLRKALRGE